MEMTTTKSFPGEGTVKRERRESGRASQSESSPEKVAEVKTGLLNAGALTALLLWYLFSAGTLFLNKYILSFLAGEPSVLATSQICTTTILGSIQIYFGIGNFRSNKSDHAERPANFYRNMIILGAMRISAVILGLLSLKFVAVSFTETVKGSAPVFTVLISRLLMGEYTGILTLLSLVPVMAGLVLCSAYELSFNFAGFIAAVLTNITDCFQNVFSKSLMSGESYKYTPLELQFYTSLASIVVQVPLTGFTVDYDKVWLTLNSRLVTVLIFDGICFHCQSLTAYILMDYISPVTLSVANTVKRAILIWMSVLIFENHVTFLSGVGTLVVTIGVLLYIKARQMDKNYLMARSTHGRAMDSGLYKVV